MAMKTFLIILAVLISLWWATASAQLIDGDRAAFMQFANAVHVRDCFSSWNNSDSSTICSWDFITCSDDGTRIIGIDVNADPNRQRRETDLIGCWRGTVPDAIAGLTALQTFSSWYFGGKFSYVTPLLFTMPALKYLDLTQMGVRIFWPPQGITAPLTHLIIRDNPIATGQFPPNTSLQNLTAAVFSYANLSCPLPADVASVLASINALQGGWCDISGNYLTITNDRICGQVSIFSNCRYTPMRLRRDDSYREDTVTVLKSKRLQVEFQERTFQVYGLFPNGSAFREEFFEFIWSDCWQGKRSEFRFIQSFQMQPFGPFKQVAPNIWTTNTTFTNATGPAFYLEWTFYLDPENLTSALPSGFKFSVDFWMTNTTYIADDIYQYLVANGNYVFRMPHSNPQSFIYCPSNTYCKSEEMDFTSVLQFASPLSFLQTTVETKKVRITLDFPTGAYADGRLLDIVRQEIDLPIVRHFHPLGSIGYLTNGDNSTYVPPGPLEEQHVSLDWMIFGKRPLFNGSYDPGISIELLFGIDQQNGPANGSPEATAIATASVGLIVGLTVGLSLFALAAISFAVIMLKVVPYRLKRQQDKKNSVLNDVDEAAPDSDNKSPRWTSGAKPKRSVSAGTEK